MTTTLVAHIDSSRVDVLTTSTTGTVRIVPGSLTIAAGLGWRDPGAVVEFETEDNYRRHRVAVTDVIGRDGTAAQLVFGDGRRWPRPVGASDYQHVAG